MKQEWHFFCVFLPVVEPISFMSEKHSSSRQVTAIYCAKEVLIKMQEIAMSFLIMEMINRHPQNIQEPRKTSLSNAIESCLNCAQVCAACSDACLGEREVERFRSVIRSTNDSNDLCSAVANILSRLNDQNPRILRSLITACIQQVQHTGIQCNEHAQHHEHCRVCSETCRACENALSEYLKFVE